ncbi:MAG: flagellar motor switch protein FliM [Syntrophomonadaceae bacterium]|nr:flagellar motor switch protein FliM [Syntrophomonadaceae bacterium]
MSEVLTQEEIDALLSAITRGEVDAEELKQEQSKKKVRVYDFRRPNKFSKEQIHTLQVIFENYSRSLGTYFSAQLHTPVTVDVLSVEQITYDEFVRSVNNPTILAIFSLPPLDGNAILEINLDLGFAILDRMFGGPGVSIGKVRSLTEIEETVMDRICNNMLYYLEEPWATIAPLKPRLERIDSNPQFTQIVSPGEMVVIVSLETYMGEVMGVINICIPFIVLEPIINKLNVNYYYSSAVRQKDPGDTKAIRKRLQEAVVPVRVLLGSTVTTIADLIELNVGDVVPLDRKVDEELEVIIGSKTKFYAKPGTFGNRMAVQITRVVQEGVDEDE